MKPALVGRVCPVEKCRAVLETRIDALGRAVTICPACQRRRQGLCVECGHAVEGRAWRCAPCKLEAKRAAYRRYHQRYLDKAHAKDRRRWRSLTPEARARRLTRRREIRNRPEARAKDRQKKREWYRAHRIWAYAYQRRYREAHRKERRAASLKAYRAHHPAPDPRCLECGAPIEWSGRGRPALRCPAHNPWSKAS